jgi:[pyruvate, water dikinase]-phosphate phosphotransferase / [pyruvate, water dikinase] kinase
MFQVFVVSDGTGRTARQALSAALTQFPGKDVEVIVHNDIRTCAQIHSIVSEAAKVHAFIVHTLVTAKLREIILRESHRVNVQTIDLMGPLLERLSDELIHEPSQQPGLFHKLNKAYFQRIDAMQFAFNHDDGQRTESLADAEIVLLGVSRTFKTPLSIYLAYKGWFAANVPIIMGIPPPEILCSLDPSRVFCLTSNAGRLTELRRTRHERLGGSTGNYADPDFVGREINYALNYYHLHQGWRIINVTSKPIEEIASEILAIRTRGMEMEEEDANE